MGYMRHHAIVCTCFQKDVADQLRDYAESLGMSVSPVSQEVTNGHVSFCIFPDGSKEGWDESDRGNIARSKWIEFAVSQKENSRYSDWVEVQFGDDERETRVCRHSDADDPTTDD